MVRITLHHIAKIEGHANLTVKIEKNKVKKCELSAIEGARFFEGLIQNRRFNEVQEITSRICGICSSAHTIASIQALENTMDVKVSEQTKLLRELLMIGERIRSHVTHLYMLALPDYLGYSSALEMAKHYKKEVETAINLIKLGNDIVTVLSGRQMHPLNITVGGSTKLPYQKDLLDLNKRLKESKHDINKTADLFLKLKYPTFNHDIEYLSLQKYDRYATVDGDLISSNTFIKQTDYKKHIKEKIEEYSTSKFALKDNKVYCVGAISRINNNYKYLHRDAQSYLKKLKLPLTNPFHNNIAQAIELVHMVNRAIELLDILDLKNEKIDFKIREGHGISVIEAPRGILIHEYKINKLGFIDYANIITPTVQNLKCIETDIRNYLPSLLKYKKEKIVLEIEKLIRAYDPCFSCSTHFLNVKWE